MTLIPVFKPISAVAKSPLHLRCPLAVAFHSVFSRVKPSYVLMLETYAEWRLKTEAELTEQVPAATCRAVCLIAPHGAAGYRKGRRLPLSEDPVYPGDEVPPLTLMAGHLPAPWSLH